MEPYAHSPILLNSVHKIKVTFLYRVAMKLPYRLLSNSPPALILNWMNSVSPKVHIPFLSSILILSLLSQLVTIGTTMFLVLVVSCDVKKSRDNVYGTHCQLAT